MATLKCQKVSYRTARAKKDPFSDWPHLKPVDKDQQNNIKAAVDAVENAAKEHCLGENYNYSFKCILRDHIHLFRKSFLSGIGARIHLLYVELVSDAKPVEVRLQCICRNSRTS